MRTWLACLAIALAGATGCGGASGAGSSLDAATSDVRTDAVAADDGLASDAGPATDAACLGLISDTGAAADALSSPLQAWCAPGTPNPTGCPASAPTPGSACPTPALRCAYGLTADGYELATCDAAIGWTSTARGCGGACGATDAGGFSLTVTASCGSAADLPCAPTDATDAERAADRFIAILACCGGLTEDGVIVRLTDGCATSIAFTNPSRSPAGAAAEADFARCLAPLLDGHRIECATHVGCMGREWSTVK